MHLLLLFSIFGFACSWKGSDIYAAIEENNIEKLSLILSAKDAEINYANPRSGFTPLILAASKNLKEMVYLLLHRGANHGIVEADGWSPLLFATAMGNTEIASALVAFGADILQKNKKGLFPLASAQERQNVQLQGIFQGVIEGRQPQKPAFLIYHKVEETVNPNQNHKTIMDTIRKHKHINEVHDMLRQPWAAPFFNIQDSFGFTALMLSCRLQLVPVVEQLISLHGDVNIAEKDGWTPLIESSFHRNTKLVDMLLNAGANPLMKSKSGQTACDVSLKQQDSATAASIGTRALANMLDKIFVPQDYSADLAMVLRCGANPNTVDSKTKATSLMLASGVGSEDDVVRLLRAGADINMIDSNNWSAIMYAAAGGSAAVTSILLDHATPVNYNQQGKTGITAMQLSVRNGKRDVEQLLQAFDTNTLQSKENKRLAEEKALKEKQQQEQHNKMSGQEAAVPTRKDVTNAIMQDDATQLQIYLNAGAEVNFADNNGYTPILLAASAGNINCLRLLLEYARTHPVGGKSTYLRDFLFAVEKDGWSALMFAAVKGRTDIVELLLEYGAYPLTMNKNGISAFELAFNNGHKQISARISSEAMIAALRNEDVLMIQRILKFGAFPGTADPTTEKTVLMVLVRKATLEIISDFLRVNSFVDVNAVDSHGWTAGMHSCARGDIEIVSILIASGVNSGLRATNGANMKSIAVDNKFSTIVKFLEAFPDAVALKNEEFAHQFAKATTTETAPKTEFAYESSEGQATPAGRDIELEMERKKNAELEEKVEKDANARRVKYAKQARERALQEKQQQDKVAAAEKEAVKKAGFASWFGF